MKHNTLIFYFPYIILGLICILIPNKIYSSSTNYSVEYKLLDSIIFPVQSDTEPIYTIYNGDLYIEELGTNLILTDPNGGCWNVHFNNSGIIVTDSIECPGGTMPVDGDGNVYSRITIGNQVWMGESLYTTSYRDGTPIAKMNNHSEVQDKTIDNPVGAYANWMFQDANAPTYGALYNYLAKDASLNGGYDICPEGYTLPTLNDIAELMEFIEPGSLNSSSNAVGSHIKQEGNQSTNPSGLWLNQNEDATNSTGFTAVPGVYFVPFGFYAAQASFWIKDVDNSVNPSNIYSYNIVNNNTWLQYGQLPSNFLYLSKIRCIQE